jgi:hypothetical protein
MTVKSRIQNLTKPTSSISKEKVEHPNENDVLCGRGSSTYVHPGNKQFRSIVARNKNTYNKSENSIKPIIAKGIVTFIRKRDPPGRFLIQDKESDNWYEISHLAAIQKTQQALREKTKWIKNDSKVAILESVQIDEDKTFSSSGAKCTKDKSLKLENVGGNDDNALHNCSQTNLFARTESSIMKKDGISIDMEKMTVSSTISPPYTKSYHVENSRREDEIDNLIVETFHCSSAKNMQNDDGINKRIQKETTKCVDVVAHTKRNKEQRLLDSNKIKSIHASFAREI